LIRTPPNSSCFPASIALPRSRVKTPAWSPYLASLAISNPSSNEEQLLIVTTGPKISSRQTLVS
jgi:hypothetical protein